MAFITLGDARVVDALYLEDCYLKECDAEVLSVEKGKYVILDRTIFHSEGGGQPWDTGELIRSDEPFRIVYVGGFSGSISHEVDKVGLKVGDSVHCLLDWDRRYRLMRSHTALHILWATLVKSIPNLEVVGTRVGVERSRFDVKTDRDALIRRLGEVETLANRIVQEDRLVVAQILNRIEAEELFRSYGEDPSQLPQAERVRVVEVQGWDISACVGTHVRRTLEVGSISILKRASKGKDIDRIYFTLG